MKLLLGDVLYVKAKNVLIESVHNNKRGGGVSSLMIDQRAVKLKCVCIN